MVTIINMPQMAANGLSENWLFKHCGDKHWEHLCLCAGTRSSELYDDAGARMYSTFVAISGRYTVPLSAVAENERFTTSGSLARFGSSIFRSEVESRERSGELSSHHADRFRREDAGQPKRSPQEHTVHFQSF